MSREYEKSIGKNGGLQIKWIKRLDGLVRVAIPAGDEYREAVVVVYSERRGKYEINLFDDQTGEVKWCAPVVNGGYGSPAFFEDCVLTLTGFTSLDALKRSNGELIWRYNTKSRIRSSIVIDGDRAVFSSGSYLIGLDRFGKEVFKTQSPRAFLFGHPIRYGTGWLSLASIYRKGTGRIALVRLSESDQEEWCVDLGVGSIASSDTSGPLLVEKNVYVAGPNSIHCIEADSGREIWREKIAPFAHRHACTSDGERVFYTTVQGRIGAVSRNSGQLLWERQLSDQGIWSPASVLGEFVLVPAGGILNALEAESGQIVQQIPVGQSPYSMVTYDGDIAMLGAGDPPYWGLLFGFNVDKKNSVPIQCSFVQSRRVIEHGKPLDLSLEVSIPLKHTIEDIAIDFSPLEGPLWAKPYKITNGRFLFSVIPGPGQKWGSYALPVRICTSSGEYWATVLIELTITKNLPNRILLPGFDGLKQEHETYSGAAVIAAMREKGGDIISQTEVRKMVDSVREKSDYLSFDTWRIVARRVMSTSAIRSDELPEFNE